MKQRNFHTLVAIILITFSCTPGNPVLNSDFELSAEFGDYWYQGQAEIAKYNLSQVRYGEMREGHAVLIFVTEDFSKSKHVKLDNQGAGNDDVLKVMKLNAMRKFKTGIYPYSTMTSVFTPIYLDQSPKSVKMTTTIQEWCGQTFLQVNLKGSKYQLQSNSYFESEGDKRYAINDVLLEDEIWNRIRLNPGALPVGALEILPGSLYCRFKHEEITPAAASAMHVEGNSTSRIYQLAYPQLDRTLAIEFDKNFPHKILGWEETYPEGGQLMTTRAVLDTAIQLDYWNKNTTADSAFRDLLGLE